MQEHGFSLIRIFPYKNEIEDSVYIRENTCHGKPVFWLFYAVSVRNIFIFFFHWWRLRNHLEWKIWKKFYRSSRLKVFSRKGALKICRKFTGEHTCQSAFIEIALWHECSPENLLHIFRKIFPKNTSGWLLLILWNEVIVS